MRIYAEKLHLLIDSREFAGVRQVTRSFGVARLCVGDIPTTVSCRVQTTPSFGRRHSDGTGSNGLKVSMSNGVILLNGEDLYIARSIVYARKDLRRFQRPKLLKRITYVGQYL